MRMRRFLPSSLFLLLLGLGCTPGAVTRQAGAADVRTIAPPTTQATQNVVAMPNAADSLKFAVLGDFGTGSKEQYDMAATMAKVHERFPYELVVLVGDNLYGSERPQDFQKKFEVPYKPLLDAGVKFYASLGNHDAREQVSYKLFNMNGKLYYSFKAPKQNVRFFALESTYMDPEEVQWVEKELKGSNDDWKIAFFHHPPYSSGERHGSEGRIRETLEPLFVKYNVSVVLTGHDHFYERIKPQQGIVYFVTGAGGQLRKGNIDKGSPLTAKGMDTDQSFMIAEINKDQMWFNAISRTGQVFDSGVITRRK
jgi:predicted MPP superfamily phosphohydrolase